MFVHLLKKLDMYEIWKAIPNYEGLYDGSNWGRVRSLNYNKTGQIRILKPGKTKFGYERVCLCKDRKRKWFSMHRLVYEAFNGKIPEGMVIDHVDGCKTNNNLSNLRCVTPKENCNNPVTMSRNAEKNRRLAQDPEFRKKHAEAVRKANRKRLNKSIVQIDKTTGETIRRWDCAMDVERELGIHNESISRCCLGKRKSAGGWKWMFFMPPAVIYDLNSLDNLTCVGAPSIRRIKPLFATTVYDYLVDG